MGRGQSIRASSRSHDVDEETKEPFNIEQCDIIRHQDLPSSKEGLSISLKALALYSLHYIARFTLGWGRRLVANLGWWHLLVLVLSFFGGSWIFRIFLGLMSRKIEHEVSGALLAAPPEAVGGNGNSTTLKDWLIDAFIRLLPLQMQDMVRRMIQFMKA